MPKKYSFKDFQKEATDLKQYPKSWRPGQIAFNLLFEKRPDLSEQIRGGMLDPFHLNERLPEFFMWCNKHWEDPTPTERLLSFFKDLVVLLDNAEDPMPDQKKIQKVMGEAHNWIAELEKYTT